MSCILTMNLVSLCSFLTVFFSSDISFLISSNPLIISWRLLPGISILFFSTYTPKVMSKTIQVMAPAGPAYFPNLRSGFKPLTLGKCYKPPSPVRNFSGVLIHFFSSGEKRLRINGCSSSSPLISSSSDPSVGIHYLLSNGS